MGKWKPIETAPTDGTMILLYRPKAAEWAKVTVGKYNDDKYAKKPKPFWEIWFKLGGVTDSRLWVPTYWMPIPEQPKIEEGLTC